MPYKPRMKHLFQMLLRRRNPEAAEGLFFEATMLAEHGEEADARMAFRHSALLDYRFGGARYNYAALTEKLIGPGPETIAAWEDFVRCAIDDSRQRRELIAKVQTHINDLKAKGAAK
jgi:hypothetical protein